MEAFRRMKMAGKRLESLETKKYELASEFYTQDEMTQFRKVKKGKKEKNIRKRKVLKASDLVPVEKAGEGRDFGRRRRDSDEPEDEGLKKEKQDGKVSDFDENSFFVLFFYFYETEKFINVRKYAFISKVLKNRFLVEFRERLSLFFFFNSLENFFKKHL